jgi:hypothetical protein
MSRLGRVRLGGKGLFELASLFSVIIDLRMPRGSDRTEGARHRAEPVPASSAQTAPGAIDEVCEHPHSRSGTLRRDLLSLKVEPALWQALFL